MNMNRLPSKISWLASALALSLSFQSCNKQENDEMPSPSASTQVQNAIAPCKEVCLVAGQHTNVGKVEVGLNGDDIVVTYTITASNVYLLEVHVDLFDNLADFGKAGKLSGGGAKPGQFNFKRSFSRGSNTTTYTAIIPKAYVTSLRSDDECYYVATHAALSTGETAWGGGLCTPTSTGVTPNGPLQFPGANWGFYFAFCKSECAPIVDPIDFTYAWEDINGPSNDADYNDLVVQANVIKSSTQLKLQFTAVARGAFFDHKFQFKIAKTGIVNGLTGISGASSVREDGTSYYVTVFESSRAVLPTSPGGVLFANTLSSQTGCTPYAQAEVILAIDNATFPFDSSRPYEPFISVSPGGYDLYIYAVSNRDTWTTVDGKVYPNGILIPLDWRWPLEGQSINGRTSGGTHSAAPYPNFTSMTEGLTPLWHNNLANPALTFNKATCGF